MSVDVNALIAQQLAEQAAREAQPGRYDGVTLQNLAHRIEVEAAGLAAWRSADDVEPVEPDARLRAVAARSPQASAAFGLLNQGVPVIVPLDETGAPLAPPTRDPDEIASWYEPGGPYSTRWPGVPCGEQGGLFGLLVTGSGIDWLKTVATVHRPTRVERLMASISDRVDALGVPGAADNFDADEPQPKPDEVRATVHAGLWLCEDLQPHQAVSVAWTGSSRGQQAQAAMAAARPSKPRQLSAMVWSWPAGQNLPVGRELRPGVLSLPAIPAQGAELTLGGITYQVRAVPVLLSPPPDWLIAAVNAL